MLILLFADASAQDRSGKVLVFSKINRYYHESIPAGIAAIRQIAAELHLGVDTTTDSTHFTDERLRAYKAVIFLNTSGNNLLDTVEKAAFERFIRARGGYMGIHGAAATEYGWPWYGQLLGAVFDGHPEPQEGIVQVIDKDHSSVKHLPQSWKRFDEWYNFKNEVSDRHVLLALDENSYKGGTDGSYHPIAWFHDFDGGRSFYTGLGHTAESFKDPLVLQHLKEGLRYVVRDRKTKRVLVFSKTKGWKHTSIPFGVKAIQQFGTTHNFSVDTTTDSKYFTDDSLKNYDAVVFNCTTGNVLDANEQSAFERYIQAGGGFVGIHSAADTEYDWPWYGQLVGAWFESHPNNPNVRKAVIDIRDSNFSATKFLPRRWERTDEWYNYKSVFQGLKILANLDENSYEGGTMGANHPIAWYHEFDGGRSFYTGSGHTDESFSEPLFLEHLWQGLHYAMGNGSKDYSKAYSKPAPDQARFVKTVLAGNMDSPMELAVADDGRIFYTEIMGKLSVYEPSKRKSRLVYQFPVSKIRGIGLIGVTLDPSFVKNKFIYAYYAPDGYPDDSLRFRLSRFVLKADGKIDRASEKIMLNVPIQKNGGSHYGGSLAWDKDHNLYLSTGDGTSPFPSNGYAPLDERAGKEHYSLDAQRSAANTNSFQGKVLRIHPEANGSYTIPAGNLFSKDDPKTKPEIYVMGVRNPYRIAVNPKTSVLYWGDIGPDAGRDSTRGPRGYDEFNQAKKPGNFGWPYFVGNNQAYAKWDFEKLQAGDLFDSSAPVNESPNNTGLNRLPPAKRPFIWYPYAVSEQFPSLGIGGRCAIAGDFFEYPRKNRSPNSFPEYYNGQLFVADWMRNWVMSVSFDGQENFQRIENFMPNSGDFRRPIDIAFGSDGIMYMLEYGSVYGAANTDARLVKVEYISGNRPPVARAAIVDSVQQDSISKISYLTSETRRLPPIRTIAGQPPLRVKFSAAASKDDDENDIFSYRWNFGNDTANSMNAVHVFKKTGVFKVALTVSDQSGLMSTDTVIVRVGNTRPNVIIRTSANQSFAKNHERIKYEIAAKDAEDKNIPPTAVQAFYFYNPLPGTAMKFNEINYPGKNTMASSDCRSCHLPDKKAVGPSYIAIAERYKSRNGSLQQLAAKIISGGGGNWGTESVMSAHPQLSQKQAEEIVTYIFSLTDKKQPQKAIPLSGTLSLDFNDKEPRATHNIVAVYRDKGSLADTAIVTIRNETIKAIDADESKGFARFGDFLASGDHKSYLAFKNVDLTGIRNFSVVYSAEKLDGEIEVRLDSRAGPVVAKTSYNSTGSWNTTRVLQIVPEKALSGKHDVYFFAIRREPPYEDIIQIKEFRFGQE